MERQACRQNANDLGEKRNRGRIRKRDLVSARQSDAGRGLPHAQGRAPRSGRLLRAEPGRRPHRAGLDIGSRDGLAQLRHSTRSGCRHGLPTPLHRDYAGRPAGNRPGNSAADDAPVLRRDPVVVHLPSRRGRGTAYSILDPAVDGAPIYSLHSGIPYGPGETIRVSVENPGAPAPLFSVTVSGYLADAF